MSGNRAPSMPLKLKINTSTANASSPPAATPTPGTGLKLSFKPLGSAASPPATASSPVTRPAAKRKPSAKAKKRAHDDDDDDDEDELSRPAPKKKPPIGLKLSRDSLPSPSIIKLNASPAVRHPLQTPRLKIKHKGKPPPRPYGVGYDSEASDAEADPAIEENFVLRMAPGPDCDYLRRAIAEGRVGARYSEGGAQVAFKFFSKDGRRACVTVQGRHYAAILVDLPCIVESMKSWDKRGWWKAADICQMLVVLPGVLASEQAAKDAPIPKEWGVDEKLWQWPHGLTPPMRSVRRRRFRKRVSHRTIEKAEEEVERLLALDEKAKSWKAGKVEWEIIDLDRLKSQDAESQGDEDEDEDEMEYQYDEDAEGDPDEPVQGYEDGAAEDAEEEEEDPEALIARMEQELADDDGDDQDEVSTPAVAPSVTAPSTPAAESGAATPAAEQSTSAAASEDDGDDGEEEDSDEDADDEEREQAQFLTQQREEIAHLERELAHAKEQLQRQANPMFKLRFEAKIKSLKADLELKKRALGESGEDEDDG